MKTWYHPICLRCNALYSKNIVYNNVEPKSFKPTDSPDKQKMIDECWNDPTIANNIKILPLSKDSEEFCKVTYNFQANKGVEYKILLKVFNPIF